MAEQRDLPGWPKKRLVRLVRSHLWRYGIRPAWKPWRATWSWAHAIAISYFPGLRFVGMRGLSTALQIPKPKGNEDLPIFYRFGWGGGDSPEFRAAREAESRYSNLLIEEQSIKTLTGSKK